MKPTGKGSAQRLAYTDLFFLGPSTACFPGVSQQGSETGQKSQGGRCGVQGWAGGVCKRPVAWVYSLVGIAFVSWASLCPASADVGSVHPQTVPGEKTPTARSKAPRGES